MEAEEKLSDAEWLSIPGLRRQVQNRERHRQELQALEQSLARMVSGGEDWGVLAEDMSNALPWQQQGYPQSFN